jgi:hypothetical protein
MLCVSIPKELSSDNLYKTCKTHQFYKFLHSSGISLIFCKNIIRISLFYSVCYRFFSFFELPGDESLGIKTCSIVELHSFNRVVFDWCVLFLFVCEHCNTTGWLKICLSLTVLNWFPFNHHISIIGPTRCTICFHFITINSLYMFRALICSSSVGTVYTTIGIFCAYYFGWLLTTILLAASRHNTHKIYQSLYIREYIQNIPDWCRHLYSSCGSVKRR